MPVKPGVPLLVQGRKVAFFRFDGRVFAAAAECPHQGGPLAEGEIGDIEDMVEGRRCYVACPVHKFQFDLTTGALLDGGSRCGPLPVYAARVADDGMVEVGFESLAADYFI